MKRLLWFVGTIIGGGLVSCGQFRTTSEKLYKQFAREKVELTIGKYQYNEHEIRYLETGSNIKPLVLLVHGAPGSADAFLYFLQDSTLLSHAHLVAPDRPGHGYSSFGQPITSIKEQAEALKPLLKLNNSQEKPILVGHSFGGPIVARLAMDYPELVGGVILAASAVDPHSEKIWWVSYPADWKLFRWMVPRSWRVTNDEKLAHIAELENMKTGWPRITAPTTIIHGKKDKLVPVENAYFAEQELINSKVKMMIESEADHLIPWTRPDLLKSAILHCLELDSAMAK